MLVDVKAWQDWTTEEQEAIRNLGVNVIFGPGYLNELKGFDVAFRSPGIRLLEPALLKEQQRGMVLTSQIKWFLDRSPAMVIGVTGTKGKGTTSTLIYEMLSQHFKNNPHTRIYLTGNIGKVQPVEFLDELTSADIVAYEMSSFQLQDLHISPHIGVVLMVTSEHLDYHASLEEYRRAKEAIVKYQNEQDFAVINADYPASEEIGQTSAGKKYFVTMQGEVEYGCYVKHDTVMLSLNPKQAVAVLDCKDLQLRGKHNLENVCAATLAASLAGAGIDAIRSVLKTFRGLEHRLEFVGEIGGVAYYNDSFSTTPETSIAAIRAFTDPEVVILGGSSKNSDFSDLGRTIAQAKNIEALVLVGQEADRIELAITQAGGTNASILRGAKNMQEIFEQVKPLAKSGSVILLSPACASFGMFKNYKDRGEQFKEEVYRISTKY